MEQTTIKLKGAQFTLIDVKENHGELILQLAEGTIYKYYWGAMGCGIVEFIKHCSPDYVVRNLIGQQGCFTYDNKGTFKYLREHIRTEMGLPWYLHLDFQKSLRHALRHYQQIATCQNSFVYGWTSFVYLIDFALIENSRDEKEIEKDFKNMSEVWHFCQDKHSDTYNQLTKLITQLKTQLNATDNT